jgi:hypothetical protein
MPAYSNLYFDDEVPPQTAADQVGLFLNAVAALQTTGITCAIEPDIPIIDPVTGQITDVVSVEPPTVTAPVGGTPALPPANQLLLRLRTAAFLDGRRLQGRCFIPRIRGSAQSGDVPSTAARGTLEAAADHLISGTGNQLLVWSRKNGAVSAVEQASTWSQFAVLRSRRD